MITNSKIKCRSRNKNGFKNILNKIKQLIQKIQPKNSLIIKMKYKKIYK